MQNKHSAGIAPQDLHGCCAHSQEEEKPDEPFIATPVNIPLKGSPGERIQEGKIL